MGPNVLDIDFKLPFDEDAKLNATQRKYNQFLERLYEDAGELVAAKQEVQWTKDQVIDAASNIESAAQGGDVDDIRNALSNVEGELYDFECALNEVEDLEKSLAYGEAELIKMEKKLKIQPKMRKMVLKELEEQLEGIE